MSTRWFGDPVDEVALDATLARLVEDVSRLLDQLEGTPVAPAAARVDPEAAAVVQPLRHIPGASLVVQVAEWSSGVGCWWSAAGDPTAGPAAGELFAEFALRPDGPARAVAWLERELRRPVAEREDRFGWPAGRSGRSSWTTAASWPSAAAGGPGGRHSGRGRRTPRRGCWSRP